MPLTRTIAACHGISGGMLFEIVLGFDEMQRARDNVKDGRPPHRESHLRRPFGGDKQRRMHAGGRGGYARIGRNRNLGTLHGFGPFARESRNESLLFLQSFLGVVAVVTMAFAAAFTENRRAEEESRYLATSDPLTGLGNYRKLIDTLEAETRRSDRTGRSFALLLMDLDGLKMINDANGHVVGSRALCRMAKASGTIPVKLTRLRVMVGTSLRS